MSFRSVSPDASISRITCNQTSRCAICPLLYSTLVCLHFWQAHPNRCERDHYLDGDDFHHRYKGKDIAYAEYLLVSTRNVSLFMSLQLAVGAIFFL